MVDQPVHRPVTPSDTLEGTPTRLKLLLWFLFFFQSAAVGVYLTFLNVYYKDAGLNGTQIGLISMVSGMAGMAGSFLWGYLSDRTGKPSILIAVGAVGGLLLAQLIPVVKWMGLSDAPLWYTLIGCAGSLMSSACYTLVDSTTLAILDNRRKDYGRYRQGGSVGYIVGILAAGFLIDRASLVWMFPVYAALMFVFSMTALRLPKRAARLQDSGWGQISLMVRKPAWLVLMGTVFLFWMAYYGSSMFIGVVLKSMGASAPLISFAVVIGAVIEIPCMAISGQLIQRFGAARLLWFALALQIIRFFLISRLTNPAWAVAINLINGPGFVFTWNSFLNLISRMAPPSLLATSQGLFAATTGLAGIVSSIVGGVLLDQIGASGLYLILSGLCLAAFLLFGVGNILRPVLKEPAVDQAA